VAREPCNADVGCSAIEVALGGACIEHVDRFAFLGDFSIVIEYEV
jgi:hypothetical protein